ncbi:hypothetical protein SDC9_129204 [bioreactor metagenome]|uniref:Uncharacterized protein n=1 Tax=bioreactor metagenome TaxID=1076179 RepID=A0A645CZ51_9ZZZZ
MVKLMSEKEAYAFLTGIAEMTNGCLKVSVLNIEMNSKLALMAFALSWSGFSIIAQTLNIISKTDIRPQKYILAKAIHSVFSIFYSLVIFPILNSSLPASIFYDKSSAVSNVNTILLHISIFIIILHLTFKALKK